MAKSLKTTEERIASAEDKIKALTALIERLKNPQPAASRKAVAVVRFDDGDEIEFSYGRKEQVILTGKVLGVRLAEAGAKGGDFVKVVSGEGIEMRILSIRPSDILRNLTNPEMGEVGDAQCEPEQAA